MSGRLPQLVLALAAAGACASSNAMWSARQVANEARALEAEGRASDAAAAWARAAVKAESAAARHPGGPLVDEALTLQGEALARIGSCDVAEAPLRRVLEGGSDGTLRERAALVLAQCALDAGDPAAAERALVVPLESRDRGRRSRAAYLAGRAAVLRGDVPAALERLAGSEDAAAGFTRARLLAAAGRTGEVAALLDTLTRRRFVEAEWAAALDDVARASGPDVAAHTLDRLLARQRVRDRERARLLLADGNRRLAGGELDAAQRRYAQAERAAPDSVEGQRARLLLVRVTASRAERPDELAAVARRLTELLQSGPGGPVGAEALAFQETVRRVLVLDASGDAALFRAAELARDSLGSALLAGRLFLRIVTLAPSSLFAPKALVAAAGLLPQSHDSLVALLSSRYPTSPYTLAVRGEASPAYAAAEDSLARALGLELRSPPLAVAATVRPPVPGRRGPTLDAP